MLVVSDFIRIQGNPNNWMKHPAQFAGLSSISFDDGQLSLKTSQCSSPLGAVHKVSLKAKSICHIYVEAKAAANTKAYVFVSTFPDCQNVVWETHRLPVDSWDTIGFYFNTIYAEEYYIGVLISSPKMGDSFCIKQFVVAGYPTTQM